VVLDLTGIERLTVGGRLIQNAEPVIGGVIAGGQSIDGGERCVKAVPSGYLHQGANGAIFTVFHSRFGCIEKLSLVNKVPGYARFECHFTHTRDGEGGENEQKDKRYH